MRFLRLWHRFTPLALGLLAACADNPVAPSVAVSIDTPATTTVIVGDAFQLTASASDGGVVTWQSRAPAIATVREGVVEGVRPGTARIVAVSGTGADSVSVTVDARPGGYAADEIDYFLDIALGFEFGGASRIVRKWRTDVRLRVNGMASVEDSATITQVIGDINALTSTVDIVLVDDAPMIEVHLVPESQFPSILPNWVPGNVGFFSVWFDAQQFINRAVVLISTDIRQDLRDHLIREEVTQSLGLGRDSPRYPQSTFYSQFSLTNTFSSIDEAVVELLYRPEMAVGMDADIAGPVARRLVRVGYAPATLLSTEATVAPVGRSGSGSGGGSGLQSSHPILVTRFAPGSF